MLEIHYSPLELLEQLIEYTYQRDNILHIVIQNKYVIDQSQLSNIINRGLFFIPLRVGWVYGKEFTLLELFLFLLSEFRAGNHNNLTKFLLSYPYSEVLFHGLHNFYTTKILLEQEGVWVESSLEISTRVFIQIIKDLFSNGALISPKFTKGLHLLNLPPSLIK